MSYFVPIVNERGNVVLSTSDRNDKYLGNFIPNSEGKPYFFSCHVKAIRWVFDNVKDELIEKQDRLFRYVDSNIYRSWYLKDPSIK